MDPSLHFHHPWFTFTTLGQNNYPLNVSKNCLKLKMWYLKQFSIESAKGWDLQLGSFRMTVNFHILFLPVLWNHWHISVWCCPFWSFSISSICYFLFCVLETHKHCVNRICHHILSERQRNPIWVYKICNRRQDFEFLDDANLRYKNGIPLSLSQHVIFQCLCPPLKKEGILLCTCRSVCR